MENKNNFPNLMPSVRCLVTDDQDRILLVQRSAASRHNPGEWEIPGGKLEKDAEHFFAEDAKEAIIRELEEEAGITPVGISDPILIEGRPIHDGHRAGEITLTFVSHARDFVGVAAVSDHENSDLGWFAADGLPPNVTHVSRLAIQKFIGQ